MKTAFPQIFDFAEAMQNFAAAFASQLPDDAILALHGTLGTGKTTFTVGLARGLKISEPVTSPSFNIYTIYESGSRQLVHMDAYRLAGTRALDGLMLEEFMHSPFIWVIEWPEKIADALPPNALHLYFSILENGAHCIDVKAHG